MYDYRYTAQEKNLKLKSYKVRADAQHMHIEGPHRIRSAYAKADPG